MESCGRREGSREKDRDGEEGADREMDRNSQKEGRRTQRERDAQIKGEAARLRKEEGGRGREGWRQ